MSHNVLKLSKPSSQPSINPVTSSHSLFHPNHLSLDFPKERESVSHFKDSQSHSASQANIKKLAGLLNPRKERGLTLQDIHSSTSPNHTSPKSYLEISSKMNNKLRVSTSTHENQNLNLISPKDLVRLAMSKHKSKASLKKVTSPVPTAQPRNFRKSLSLRFGAGSVNVDKRDVSSKLITSTTMEENSGLSRTSVASKDRNAKLRRMKLIYNDLGSGELARLTRSTMYTPINDVSGRYLQDSTTLNKSNSGYLLPASPVLVTNVSHSKSKHHQTGHGKEEKGEKGHSKVGSGEHIGTFLKEYKPSIRDSKKKEKKASQSRKMPSMENIKTQSHSFSRLMSHPTLNLGDKTRSPIADFKELLEEDEIETGEILQQGENKKGKDSKPREEFIADLKSWVNDIVKPTAEETITVAPPQKKNTAAAEKVKEAQEGLLEKLRDALENDEYVRREDYERLYREKESIEDELDGFKEENAKLRDIVWRLQEELEARKQKEKEMAKNSLPLNVSMSDHGDELMEMIMKQQEEIEAYKKRENVVNDLIKMIWKAGAKIGDLGYVQEANEGEEQEYDYQDQDHYEQAAKYYGNGHVVHQNQEFHNQKPYKGNNKKYEKHPKNAYPTASNKDESLVEENIYSQDQVVSIQYKEASSRVVKALSELGDSETDSSEQTGRLEGLPMNPKINAGFPLKNEHKDLKQTIHHSKSTGKLKIDMDGLGEKIVAAKKRHPTPSYKTIEKINNFIVNENGQNLGFHEEFMSKLEEFSPSWRQAALADKKY